VFSPSQKSFLRRRQINLLKEIDIYHLSETSFVVQYRYCTTPFQLLVIVEFRYRPPHQRPPLADITADISLYYFRSSHPPTLFICVERSPQVIQVSPLTSCYRRIVAGFRARYGAPRLCPWQFYRGCTISYPWRLAIAGNAVTRYCH